MIRIKKNRIILLGFLIYTLTHLILFFLTDFFQLTPFMSHDDMNLYDGLGLEVFREAKHYLNQRQVFILICGIFNQIRIGKIFTGTRILNIVIYWLVCIKIRKISLLSGYSEKFTNIIFIFFTLIPYHLIFTSTLYKDTMCAYLVLKIFEMYFVYKQTNKVNILVLTFCGIMLYFLRFGLVESLICLMAWDYIKNKKSSIKIIFCILICGGIALIMLSQPYYVYLLKQKIDAYFLEAEIETGLLRYFRITKIGNIFRLPFLIVFAQIHPWPTNYPAFLSVRSWGALVGYFSYIQIFFIPFFWYYILKKKKNENEKSLILYYVMWMVVLAISSPGTSRFFFFLSPLFFLISVKSFLDNKNKIELYTLSFLMIGVVLIYTIINVEI